MAFRLHADESVTHGLHRLSRKELEAARDELRRTRPPHEEPVHEARRSVKKLRAILQLIDDDDGTGLKGSRRRLRSINRILSDLRDADVMMETLENLRTTYPHALSAQAFARARRRLAARKRAAVKAVAGMKTWKAIDWKLRTVRRDAKHWQPTHRGADALQRAIRAAHRRGRDAMKRAVLRRLCAQYRARVEEMAPTTARLRRT